MNNGGDEAEQVVRLSLKDFEVAAKLTGSVAKKCRPAAGVRPGAVAFARRPGGGGFLFGSAHADRIGGTGRSSPGGGTAAPAS